ncbi:hypothetical protein [Acidithrix sp. C25]|uniref:hypothetical protein n=1 Tax=Acidithrix sp. C25 TaxID=1671482 RepID=UPI00191B9C27|nr:hypothetical protein [Acidithrix sp. C25]
MTAAGQRLLVSTSARQVHHTSGPTSLIEVGGLCCMAISRINRRKVSAPAAADDADFQRPSVPVATANPLTNDRKRTGGQSTSRKSNTFVTAPSSVICVTMRPVASR